jgi:hypothetical protein
MWKYKIMNGRISDLSIELLIRVAVRAGLSIAIYTGRVPQESGAFISTHPAGEPAEPRSRLADAARASLLQSGRRLSPSEGLEAFLEHNQLVAEFGAAGRRAEHLRRGGTRQ